MKKDDLRPYPYDAHENTNERQFEKWVTEEDNNMDKRDAFTKGWLLGFGSMAVIVAILIWCLP